MPKIASCLTATLQTVKAEVILELGDVNLSFKVFDEMEKCLLRRHEWFQGGPDQDMLMEIQAALEWKGATATDQPCVQKKLEELDAFFDKVRGLARDSASQAEGAPQIAEVRLAN